MKIVLNTRKLYPTPANFTQHQQIVLNTRKLYSTPANCTQHSQILHNTCRLYTAHADFTQHLQIVHTTCKLCTTPIDCTIHLQLLIFSEGESIIQLYSGVCSCWAFLLRSFFTLDFKKVSYLTFILSSVILYSYIIAHGYFGIYCNYFATTAI